MKEPLRGVEPFAYDWTRIAIVVIDTLAEERTADFASRRAISRTKVSRVVSCHLRGSAGVTRRDPAHRKAKPPMRALEQGGPFGQNHTRYRSELSLEARYYTDDNDSYTSLTTPALTPAGIYLNELDWDNKEICGMLAYAPC